MLVLRSKYDKVVAGQRALDEVLRYTEIQFAGAKSTIEILTTTVIGLKDEKIAELKAALKKQEDATDRERIRADQSVDNLLSRVAQVAPISDPSFSGANKTEALMKEMEEMFEEDPDIVKGIIKRIEDGDTSVMEEAGEQRSS